MPEQLARPDSALWDEPTMHRVLAARDITKLYRALVELGFAQSQIAQLTDQSQSEVSEILKGRRVISYELLKRIADGLGIPRGHMGLAYTDAEGNVVPYPGEEGEGNTDPLEDDDVVSRRVLGIAAGALLGDAVLDGPIMQMGTHLLGEPGGIPSPQSNKSMTLDKLTQHDVAWIRTAADRLWELDLAHGGVSIFGAAWGLASQVVGALRNSTPNRELQLAASNLCRVAAWTAFDADHKRTFWEYHATALELAQEAKEV